MPRRIESWGMQYRAGRGSWGRMSMSGMNDAPNRSMLIAQAFRLEYVTLAWMIVETAIAIGSGVAAGSLLLLAFGIDSLIELASAVVLIWRLDVELRRSEVFAENAERTAVRIGAVLLFARRPARFCMDGREDQPAFSMSH